MKFSIFYKIILHGNNSFAKEAKNLVRYRSENITHQINYVEG